MFKNPLSKYQQGGQISQEQQEMIAAFVEWLPTAVKEFAGMGSEQVIEALNGMSKTEEGQKQVQGWVEQFQKELQNRQQSALFAKGGKLHAFICRHAKGGHIADCGCKEDGGKVEKNQNGKWISGDKTITILNPGTAQADTLGTYSYTNRSGEFRFKPNGERTLTEWFDGDFLGQRYASPEWFQNHPYKNAIERILGVGRKPLTSDLEENARKRVENRTKVQKDQNGTSGIPTNSSALENYLTSNIGMPNSDNLFTGKQVASLINTMHLNQPLVQVQQDGGNLSRQEALAAAMERYGFTKEQARTAYANAKYGLRKQGLHGKELKQKAREMIMSRPQSETLKLEASSSINLPTPKVDGPQAQVVIKRPELKPNYDGMSFNNAFRAARNISQNGGESTFTWHGKKYGTALAKPKVEQVNTPKLPVISDEIDIPEEPIVDLTIPEITVEPLHVPLMGTTPEARSLRTVNPTPFISQIPGVGEQVYSTINKPKQTVTTTSVQKPRNNGPMGEVQTLVGTGYMPLIPRTEEEILARLNRSARTSEQEINNEKMPPLWLGRWDAKPQGAIKSKLIYNGIK